MVIDPEVLANQFIYNSNLTILHILRLTSKFLIYKIFKLYPSSRHTPPME